MNITVIGSGYVGLVSGACFSEFGFEVVCVDKDEAKIDRLKKGAVPIYEPGLDELIARNVAAGRLKFATDLAETVASADAVFITVGTPTRRGDGHADLSYVYAAAEEVAGSLEGYTVIVTKSTVPVGTGRIVEERIRAANPRADFDVASNPEFLREGSAIGDFMRPDRVIVGVESAAAKEVMTALYRPLFIRETPVLFTSLETSEMIKYASNGFLAMKISFINQMADLCEAVGADVHGVAKGMGLDKRIGSKFLHPGPGYGGSCFPKDTLALKKTAEDYGVPTTLIEEVVRYNAERKRQMAERIRAFAGGDLRGQSVGLLGLAFKPETDDMRDSPVLDIVPRLVAMGAKLCVYDPAAIEEARAIWASEGALGGAESLEGVAFCESAVACIKGADVVVVVTEWNEFRALEPQAIKALMRGDVVVDLRNIFDGRAFERAGLRYLNIGRAGMVAGMARTGMVDAEKKRGSDV